MSQSTALPPTSQRDRRILPPSRVYSSTSYSPEPPSPLSDFTDDQTSFAGEFLNRCKVSAAKLQRSESPRRQLQRSLTSAFANSFISSSDQDPRRQSNLFFGDLFSGSSAPINIGFIQDDNSEEESEEETEMDGIYTRAPQRARRPIPVKGTHSVHNRSQGSLGRTSTISDRSSRFAWFTRSNGSQTPETIPASSVEDNDPLLTMSIANVLFPHGHPDPLAPHSFHDLVDSSTSLLATFQSAYRAQHAQMDSVRAEHSALLEEFAEMETRSKHLKLQLHDMASQVERSEAEKRELRDLLNQEQQETALRESARKRSLNLVASPFDRASDSPELPGTKHIRCYRGESGSTTPTTDSGFESEAESSSGSIFSKTSGVASIPSTDTTWDDHETPRDLPSTEYNRRSMFDDVLDVMRKKENPNHLYKREFRPAGSGGQHSSVGNGNLAERNAWLEQRVLELEHAVDSCLDLVC
ncbi:hypothetical protein P152DRAFT_457521 [Eremomyces bilateralis CBS 781.70]|uniref:Uncharacterized protein n=1 Tax=Eremomyces bilateralis CBS 781.70 TaxID=1392243 RepID=A0A6G1G581_9PEZI|nr:uncharacterized protein P152DRAFT_457521 [Eremomyces bilateralis CBS 781.70]KAF1813162.1 hypothetical protein P152DRAFT_457521 [Eremomyces bilateralis CBS 781.70]